MVGEICPGLFGTVGLAATEGHNRSGRALICCHVRPSALNVGEAPAEGNAPDMCEALSGRGSTPFRARVTVKKPKPRRRVVTEASVGTEIDFNGY